MSVIMKYCCNRTTEAKTKPSIELSKQNKTVHRTIEAKGNYAALPPLLHPLIIAGFCHSSHDLLSQNFLRISSIDVVRIRVHGLPIGMDHMNNGYGNDFTTPALLSVVDACKLRMLELMHALVLCLHSSFGPTNSTIWQETRVVLWHTPASYLD